MMFLDDVARRDFQLLPLIRLNRARINGINREFFGPLKADAPLLIDTNAEVPIAVSV
jgi:hypothetical protein